MLLRTVVLLALCVSSGMCATLGYYQTQEPEEGVPTADSAVASVDDAAKEGVNAEVAKEEGTLLGKILTANNQGDSKPVDVQVADDAKKPEADSHGTKEAVAQNQPSSEEEANEIKPVQKNESLNRPLAREDKTNSWGLDSIRSSFQTVHGYFDSLVELVGGPDGVCQYRCRYGKNEPCQCFFYILLMSRAKVWLMAKPQGNKKHPVFSGCYLFACLAHFQIQSAT